MSELGEHVDVTTDDHGVATIRVDRAPVNALNRDVWTALERAAIRCADDDEVRAVVLWGGPKVFAAGADIKAMQRLSYAQMQAQAGGLQRAFAALAGIPKVVIAAVNGYALGGGCELCLTADFRFAADDATFGQPEIKLGIIPGAGGTQRLTRLVGVSKAKEMVYGGGFVSAAEAHAIGLADRVLPAEEVYDAAVEAAHGYAEGPFALRLAKQAIDDGIELDLDSALRLESALFAATFATEDRAAGMASFLADGPGKATFTGS